MLPHVATGRSEALPTIFNSYRSDDSKSVLKARRSSRKTKVAPWMTSCGAMVTYISASLQCFGAPWTSWKYLNMLLMIVMDHHGHGSMPPPASDVRFHGSVPWSCCQRPQVFIFTKVINAIINLPFGDGLYCTSHKNGDLGNELLLGLPCLPHYCLTPLMKYPRRALIW